MGEFETANFERDIQSAESALDWSNEDGLFGRKSLNSLLSAAKYFKTEADTLRTDYDEQSTILSSAENELAETIDKCNQLTAENMKLKEYLKHLISTGGALAQAVSDTMVDGRKGLFEQEVANFDTAANAATDSTGY